MNRALLAAALLIGAVTAATARDDGRYAAEDPELHKWFDGLASGKGLCCSFADGIKVDDPEWGISRACTNTDDGELRCINRFWVLLHGQVVYVPETALVTDRNRKIKYAVVWPYLDAKGVPQIRCFLPGPGY